MTAPKVTPALCIACGACCSAFVDGEFISCRHLLTDQGFKCAIYETRPAVCRSYECVKDGKISDAVKTRVLEAERILNS